MSDNERTIYKYRDIFDVNTANMKDNEIIKVFKKVKNFEIKYENNEKLEFKYITKEIFDELENPTVVGKINIEERSNSKKENIVLFETDDIDFSFKLVTDEEFANGKTLLGYIEVEENIFVEVYKKKVKVPEKDKYKPMAIALMIVLALVIVFAIRALNKTEEPPATPTYSQPLEIEEGTDWDGKMPQNGENSKAETGSIEIPGYANLFISEQEPDIQLINPSNNDVYFVYKITNGDDVVYETKAIEPGKTVDVPLGTILGSGEYQLSFEISCFDVVTQAPCNGAVQTVKLTVR